MRSLRLAIIGLFLVIVWVGAFEAVSAGESIVLRPGGANKNYPEFTIDTTSSGGFYVDTLTSDTFDLRALVPADPSFNVSGPGQSYGDFYNQVLVTLVQDTVIKCDSCVAYCSTSASIWTVDQNGMEKALTAWFKPFASGVARDTSTTYRFWLNGMGSAASKDSVVYDKIFVKYVVADSAVANKLLGVAATRQPKFYQRFFVWLMK